MKPLSIIRKCPAKNRELYAGFIASLFSGLIIGIFWTVLQEYPSPNQFSWNLSSIVYISTPIIYSLILLIALYFVGKLFIIFILSSKQMFSYKLNFIIGVLASIFIGLFIIFKDATKYIAGSMILTYFIISYLVARYIKR